MKMWRKRLSAGILCLMVLTSSVSVLAAVQGSKENPLVTLGYLTAVFSKSVSQDTDKKIAESKATYEKKLDDKITGYKKEMQNLSGGGSGASFTVVDLTAGQALTGAIGCELMLRVGTASCQSPQSPGLIDSTTGGVLEGGADLEKNHLYMMTIEGRAVKAQGAAKLLVRGSYTIQ